MVYVVLKKTKMDGKIFKVLINDNEGIAYEFDSEEEAQRIADLFQKNSTHGSTYEVKKMG